MNDLPRFQASPLIVIAPESQVQATIEEMAQYLGYRTYHETDSRKSERGFPDLTLAGVGKYRQIVYVEVKRDPKNNTKGEIRDTSPSVEQVDWLRSLRLSGHHAYVVRGSQIGILERVLRMEIDPPDEVSVSMEVAELIENERNPKVVPLRKKKGKRHARIGPPRR